jgi:cytochrome c oxidase subunit I
MAGIAQPYAPGYRRPLILDWLTTVDHKRLGILYFYTTFTFFAVAGFMGLALRTQLAVANNDFLAPETYNQMFTIHGTTMIWLFAIPMWSAFGNYFVPLQIGAGDMAFPRINALSYWLLPTAGLIVYSGFLFGNAADAGWTSYAPLSEHAGGPGIDLWLMGIIIVGISSTIGAANFLVTIFRMRAPGMTLFRTPIFTWSILVNSLLQLLATPVLTSALAMLYIDRNFGGGFFDPSRGGNALLWQNVFWFYSHPAVYIMILPGFGIISEILPVFARKPLFGYKAMIFSLIGIGMLAFSVWAHHMFTTGAVLKPWFGFMTFLIGVPTGVKFFNWIGTLWRGSITLNASMMFCIAFLLTFLIGGISGVVTASVPTDFALHDTYFVVGHIHYVLFGGAIFSAFAGIFYWFPKVFGRQLNNTLGIWQAVLLFIGFNVTFFPMHLLGLEGMPRRIVTYANEADWQAINFTESMGAICILVGMLVGLTNLIITFRGPKDQPNDPWEGNTLEWWATSPPPPHNFDTLPEIHSERPLWDLRHGLTSEHAILPTSSAPAPGSH